MKSKNLFVLFLFGFLYACAHSPTIKEDVEEKKEIAEQEEINQKNLPNQELTAAILFDLLVGETALQRGSLDVALNRYLKLAKSTRDLRLAKRASEIALHTGDPNAAVLAGTCHSSVASVSASKAHRSGRLPPDQRCT